jgi:adenylate kinase family enzyme
LTRLPFFVTSSIILYNALDKNLNGTLTFFCGKMGSGKTTLAAKLANDTNAFLLSEDVWLEQLYPNQIKTLSDYVYYSNLIKPMVRELVNALLESNTDVVMDFPANTERQREWLCSITDNYRLYYIDVSDEDCLSRLKSRGKPTDTEEMFWAMRKHFVKPKNFLTL